LRPPRRNWVYIVAKSATVSIFFMRTLPLIFVTVAHSV
jgi:hypothetical protein